MRKWRYVVRKMGDKKTRENAMKSRKCKYMRKWKEKVHKETDVRKLSEKIKRESGLQKWSEK